MNLFRRINWLNTSFLVLTPIVGITGIVLLLIFSHIHWATWVLLGSLSLFTGLSITAGYHRLFSHKSYKAHWLVRLFFLLFASAGFEGSVLEWCTDHRNHHRYTDTSKDPYNIKQGFWYAHIGWLIFLDPSKRDFSNVADLAEDPLVRLQHKYFVPLSLILGFGLPTALGALWGDALGGLVVAGIFRAAINHHFTFCINSVCHWFGKQPYSERQSARDHWFTALFTFGEGFHNFHHQFPIDYRNGIRFYHFDPTKWLIRALSFLGLAYELKAVTPDRIQAYKNRMSDKYSSNTTDDADLLDQSESA